MSYPNQSSGVPGGENSSPSDQGPVSYNPPKYSANASGMSNPPQAPVYPNNSPNPVGSANPGGAANPAGSANPGGPVNPAGPASPAGPSHVVGPQPVVSPQLQQGSSAKNSIGLIGMILSLVGLVVGSILTIPGAIMGGIALRLISKGEANNKGQAMTALIVGIVGFILQIILGFVLVFGSALMSS